MSTLIERARELRKIIVKAAQSLDDNDSAKNPELFDEWKPDTRYEAGHKLRYNGQVYQVNDGQGHTSQADWTPDVAKSMFRRIDVSHEGTLEDPIPYEGNMEIFNGKYYVQDGVTYLCNRDSGTPLHHALKDLVGTYVEVVN